MDLFSAFLALVSPEVAWAGLKLCWPLPVRSCTWAYLGVVWPGLALDGVGVGIGWPEHGLEWDGVGMVWPGTVWPTLVLVWTWAELS